jgi:benzoyl-CoA reductase/2-hydroxyglutaryl-CoA dehydratase subunit BcrC/BadD/HgdB
MRTFPESLDHPFLNVSAELKNRYIEELRAAGARVMGYFCSYAPRELFDAAGLVPYRMRASYTTTTDQADSYLGSVNCSYTRCMLESIFDEALDFVDGYVFTASCDHLRRLYDNLRYLKNPKLCHILDLPHKTHEEAVDWYAEELDILRRKIERAFGLKIEDSEIASSIRRTNALREIIGKIQELRARPRPPITGEEMHKIMAAVNSVPADVATRELKEIYSMLEEREPPGFPRARLLIMGSHMDDPAYIGAMEEMGGLVVADALCVGSIQFSEMVEENMEPIRALAARYLRKLSCPRMFEAFDDRYSRVTAAARKYSADGIVLETMKFCDTWGMDAAIISEALRADGFDVLRLEREYTRGGIGQLRTRIQAFLEMMGK